MCSCLLTSTRLICVVMAILKGAQCPRSPRGSWWNPHNASITSIWISPADDLLASQCAGSVPQSGADDTGADIMDCSSSPPRSLKTVRLDPYNLSDQVPSMSDRKPIMLIPLNLQPSSPFVISQASWASPISSRDPDSSRDALEMPLAVFGMFFSPSSRYCEAWMHPMLFRTALAPFGAVPGSPASNRCPVPAGGRILMSWALQPNALGRDTPILQKAGIHTFSPIALPFPAPDSSHNDGVTS
jgi:hypothetical protein